MYSLYMGFEQDEASEDTLDEAPDYPHPKEGQGGLG